MTIYQNSYSAHFFLNLAKTYRQAILTADRRNHAVPDVTGITARFISLRFIKYAAVPAVLFQLSSCSSSSSPSGSEVITVIDTVSVTQDAVNGVNDVATFTGTDTGSVSEDTYPTSDNRLKISGSIVVNDINTGESSLVKESVPGSYGILSIETAGSWSYSVNNAHTTIQGLKTGQQITDTLTIRSLDGTQHNIVILLNGADDVAVISGDKSGTVTEGVDPDGDNFLETTGKLNIIDNDAGESGFKTTVPSGLYGSLTIDIDGNWSYSADNTQPIILALVNGATLTDKFTITSIDGGTSRDVSITINSRDIGFSWSAPTEREDTSLLPPGEISGYRVYYGTTPGDYQNTFDNGNSTQYTTTDLPTGATYYFVITCVDSDGRESSYSTPEVIIRN